MQYLITANSLNMKAPAYELNSERIYIDYFKDEKLLLGSEKIITVPAQAYDK